MSVYDTLVLDKFLEGSGQIELVIANICDIRPNCKILVAVIEVKLVGMILNLIVYDWIWYIILLFVGYKKYSKHEADVLKAAFGFVTVIKPIVRNPRDVSDQFDSLTVEIPVKLVVLEGKADAPDRLPKLILIRSLLNCILSIVL